MEENKLHNLIMEKRGKLSVSGVEDLGTYNEEMVELTTNMGNMVISGSELHITRFNIEDGELKVEGNFNSVCYEEEKKKKEGFWSGIFK